MTDPSTCARILELGCGAGVPDTFLLSERFRVTGVDISEEQSSRARANVPDADFIQTDLTALELEPAQFDAVTAFYSFPEGDVAFHWVLARR